MCSSVLVITLILAAVAAADSQVRAPGLANIGQYPEIASCMRIHSTTGYTHACAGVILNNRSILNSARCTVTDVSVPNRWQVRVGSGRLNYGGRVYNVNRIAVNNFDEWSMVNDVSVLRTSTNIAFGPNVQPGRFAGPNYLLNDNQQVNTVGWGYVGFPQWSPYEFRDLRRVNQVSVNLNTCRNRYSAQGLYVQYSQFCSGFYNPSSIGGSSIRDRCFGEPGAPVYHSGVVVGIRSYGINCFNDAYTPSVNTRISSHINWISNNA